MKKIIGYQIVSDDGENNIPDEFYSFEIFEKFEHVIDWLEEEKNDPTHEIDWVILPIFEGDIEEPTIISI